jgi:pSer/pThr/pTyr-binding forkhead associated (FHA) protein/outer membrane biosynthesis protein TonB
VKQPVVLRIYLNGKLEGVKQFTEPQIVFGRNPEAQVDLQDEEVSLLHAAIVEQDGKYVISDMGTQSGTFVNGEKILEAEIQSEDEIQVGPYQVQFFVGIPKPGSLAPKAGTVVTTVARPTEEPKAEEPPLAKEEPALQQAVPAAEPMAAEQPVDDSRLRHKEKSFQDWEPPPVEVKQEPEPEPIPEPGEIDDKTMPAVEMEHELTAPGNVQVSDLTNPGTTDVSELTDPGGIALPELTDPGVEPKKNSAASPGSQTVADRRIKQVKFTPATGIPQPSKHSKKTFAPPSQKEAMEILKPSKGTVIEVVVAWKERIISTHHFHSKGIVTIGSSDKADIVVPVMQGVSSYPLVEIGAMAAVNIAPNTSGDLIDQNRKTSFADLAKANRFKANKVGHQLDLNQGEMVRIGFQGGLVNVFVRYVPETQKPLVAPFLDLTASEVTGVILAAVVSAIFGVYMFLYSPTNLNDEARLEEPIRKATVTFKPPRRIKKQIVETKQKPEKKPKKVVKVVKKQKVTKTPSKPKAGKPGKAGEVASKKTKSTKKTVTSARPGGAIKTGKKKGANMKSRKPDPSTVGLLSVFGSKGAQKKLDKAFSGSGELMGMADQATGYAGDNENRAGDTLGTKIKDTGAGGKGQQAVGIAGVGTKGKGTGSYGLEGTGGIGTKGSVEINVGGQQAEFVGSMDREAIRRVILNNKRAIRSCYERELQRQPNMYGKLVLQWNIEEKGKVTEAKVKSSSLGSNKVAACIISRLRTWRFPEPPPGTIGQVSYPFVFTSQ